MKKFIALAIVVLCVMSVSAQKGTWYLGTSGFAPFGDISDEFASEGYAGVVMGPMTGFSTLDVKDAYTATSFGLAPEVGYFITDNLALGLGIYYTNSALKPEGGSKTSFNTFGVNPYARYYFLAKGDFKMYGQFNIAYGTTKADTDGAKSFDALAINVMPGVSYNLSERFAINATFGDFGYASMKHDDFKATGFGLNVDMSTLQFGFSVAF